MRTRVSKLLGATLLATLIGVPLAHAQTSGTPTPEKGQGDTMRGADMTGMMGMMQMMAKMAPMMATELGLDLDRLTADMQDQTVTAHIDKSNALTSSFVISETIIRGYSSDDDLAVVVGETRAPTKAAATAGTSDE